MLTKSIAGLSPAHESASGASRGNVLLIAIWARFGNAECVGAGPGGLLRWRYCLMMGRAVIRQVEVEA